MSIRHIFRININHFSFTISYASVPNTLILHDIQLTGLSAPFWLC